MSKKTKWKPRSMEEWQRWEGPPKEEIPDGNVHTMPIEGLKHDEHSKCWCNPELHDDFTDQGGVKHYLHREVM